MGLILHDKRANERFVLLLFACRIDLNGYFYRGGGTGGAGGAIAPPTFGSSIIVLSYSTTNIFGWLNLC